jgi:hypothetical protein
VIRWGLGFLIVAGMGGAGYAVLRPRVDRPTLVVGSYLPKDDPISRAIGEGVRRALEERDGRGGGFKVSYEAVPIPESWRVQNATCRAEDSPADDSNSNYAALGLRMPGIILPGLGRTEIVAWPSDGGLLVPLRLEEDGRRAGAAIRALRKTAAVVSCHSSRPPEKPVHFHSGGNVDDAAVACLAETPALAFPLSRRGLPERLLEETVLRVLESRPDLVYVDFKDWPHVVRTLRELGYAGDVIIPSARLGKDPGEAEGCLTVLSRLRPASPHPFAAAGYRSCMRYLDALDRTGAGTPKAARRAFEACIPYDPFLDPGLAELGVYRIRAGGFERVAVLP